MPSTSLTLFRTPALRRPLVLILLFNGLLFLWLVFKPGGQSVAVVDICAFVGPLLGTIIAFQGQRWPWSRPDPGGRSGPAPLLLGLAALSLACGQAFWAYYELVLHQITPFPSLADAGFLGAYPFTLLGILALPARPLPVLVRTRIVLDSLMILTAGIAFSWYFILGRVVLQYSASLFSRLVSCAYPVADLILLLCLLLLATHAGEAALGPVVQILGLALIVILMTDNIYNYQLLQGVYSPGQLLVVGWPLGYTLIGLGARAVRLQAGLAGNEAGGSRQTPGLSAMPLPVRFSPWRVSLPYALVPALGALLFYAWQAPGPAHLRNGVLLAGALLLGLILLRQVLALLENSTLYRQLDSAYRALLAAQQAVEARNQALLEANAQLQALSTTDPLTGLANHRALHSLIDHELDRAVRYGHPCSLLFLDIDHFKALNDGCGHAAGDAVLRELAALLRATLRGVDVVGRWGGEEFVVLLPELDQEAALAAAERVRAAVAAQTFSAGGGVHLTCSLGVASYPQDASEREGLVAQADRAMYAAKRLGRNQARATTDSAVVVLDDAGGTVSSREEAALLGTVKALAALVDARDHYTGQHAQAVAALTVRLAMALGLDATDAHLLDLAARLHDVGKVVIPDAVLRKPTRLNTEEWELMRTHPQAGADVISHVPALRALTPLIRGHHERWDGHGYPDGLSGEAIPLGARIIAVADAYCAMAGARPFRQPRDLDWALNELRRCSGTQFDPAVVAAMERVLAPALVAAGDTAVA